MSKQTGKTKGEGARIAALKAAGVDVCDLNCETCARRMCTGAAVLARECAEDARLHLTHKDLYQEGLERVAKRCEQAIKVAEHDGFAKLAMPTGEWHGVAVYRDGSGKAAEYYGSAVETLFAFRDVLAQQLAWINKHAETLAGLSWRVGYLKPEIEVHWGRYRGERATPTQVAGLWPGTTWRRKAKQCDKFKFDWLGEVDGVTVIIEEAETERPAPKMQDGLVDLCAAEREEEAQ